MTKKEKEKREIKILDPIFPMKYADGFTSTLQKREMEEQEQDMSLESFLKWAADLGISDSTGTGTGPYTCLGHSLSLSYFPHAGGYVQFHFHFLSSSWHILCISVWLPRKFHISILCSNFYVSMNEMLNPANPNCCRLFWVGVRFLLFF